MRTIVTTVTAEVNIDEGTPLNGSQHATIRGGRQASKAHGESTRMDPKRRQCPPGRGGLKTVRIAFIDFRDSSAGRQAYMQGSTLAVWEIMLLVRSYKGDIPAVAKHLSWPEAKVRAAVNYAGAFWEEIEEATAENDAADFQMLKRMLPQATEFVSIRPPRG